MEIIGLLLNLAIALGQQATWETHMREGDNAEWAGNSRTRERRISSRSGRRRAQRFGIPPGRGVE